jgi:hypothetical protein
MSFMDVTHQLFGHRRRSARDSSLWGVKMAPQDLNQNPTTGLDAEALPNAAELVRAFCPGLALGIHLARRERDRG